MIKELRKIDHIIHQLSGVNFEVSDEELVIDTIQFIAEQQGALEAATEREEKLAMVCENLICRLEVTQMTLRDDVISPLHKNERVNLEGISTTKERINHSLMDAKATLIELGINPTNGDV